MYVLTGDLIIQIFSTNLVGSIQVMPKDRCLSAIYLSHLQMTEKVWTIARGIGMLVV